MNPRWLVGDIRSVIIEHRQGGDTEETRTSMRRDVPKGLNKMNLAKLWDLASNFGIRQDHERPPAKTHQRRCGRSPEPHPDLRPLQRVCRSTRAIPTVGNPGDGSEQQRLGGQGEFVGAELADLHGQTGPGRMRERALPSGAGILMGSPQYGEGDITTASMSRRER